MRSVVRSALALAVIASATATVEARTATQVVVLEDGTSVAMSLAQYWGTAWCDDSLLYLWINAHDIERTDHTVDVLLREPHETRPAAGDATKARRDAVLEGVAQSLQPAIRATDDILNAELTCIPYGGYRLHIPSLEAAQPARVWEFDAETGFTARYTVMEALRPEG